MKGKYTFKQNGVVIGESHNIVTTAGRKAITDFMAGYTTKLVGALSVGIGSATAVVGDKTLQFEFARVPVDLSSADYANNAVVFKGSLQPEVVGTIYEAGANTLVESGEQYGSQMITTFDSAELWSAGSFVATNSRLDTALQVTAGASTTTTTTLSDLGIDLSGYSATDQFTLVYRANNAFVSSVVYRFKTDASNYYSTTVNTPASGTYTFTAVNKGSFTATGTPTWSNITQIDILVTATAGGTASIDLDGIRIEDRDSLREDDVLISRSVLGAPVVKTAGLPLDIEYSMTL